MRWLWDGEFCGQIGFRWQPGTEALPPHCLGHIGYAVVPWKRQRGYATRALALLLPEVRKEGLAYVELTTDPDNLPSQKVITGNGGVLVERFAKEERLSCGSSVLPRTSVPENSIEDGQELSHASGQSQLCWLSGSA